MVMAADTATKQSSFPQKPLYEASTQYRHWRFSPEKLAQTRTALNASAIDGIRKTFEVDSPGSSYNVEFLSSEEEQLLVKLYIGRISNLCDHFHFSEEVEATAASYLKRFYLKNTVMDWHPKNVMLTALFLATKTTNNPISLDTYTSHIPKTSPSDVLDLEFLVAQSLGFEFAIWHAHRALWGLWLDLQSLPSFAAGEKQDLYEIALTHVRASRLTDAELIYAPPQIALACLSLCSPQLAEEWVKLKLPVDSPANQTLHSTAESIKALITREGHPPDVESVRVVDRRLKLCKNPEKVVGSHAYLVKKAEEDKRTEDKWTRKAEEARRAMEEGDPFGKVLDEKAPITVQDVDDDDDD